MAGVQRVAGERELSDETEKEKWPRCYVVRAGDRRLPTGASSPARRFASQDYPRGRTTELGSWEKEVLLVEATTDQRGPCQVRSVTGHPCTHRAVAEIRGVPFCEPCAREQEAYFAMGELTRESQGFRGEPLVGALDVMRGEGWRYLGG